MKKLFLKKAKNKTRVTSPGLSRKKRIRAWVLTSLGVTLGFSGVVMLMQSYQSDSFLTASVYACNIEFKGEDFLSIRRVALCREGAESLYELFEKDLKRTGRSKVPSSRQEVLISQSQIRCRNEFDVEGERFACLEGIRNFAQIYQTRRMPAAFSSEPQPAVNPSQEEHRKHPRVDDSEYL